MTDSNEENNYDLTVQVPVDDLRRLLAITHPDADSFVWRFLLKELFKTVPEFAVSVVAGLHDWPEGDVMAQVFAEDLGLSETPPDPSPCGGCNQNVFRIAEFNYMTTKKVWKDAGDLDGCWCIGCLEIKLGRQLVSSDFDHSIPLNNQPDRNRSERLKNRLGVTLRNADACHKVQSRI